MDEERIAEIKARYNYEYPRINGEFIEYKGQLIPPMCQSHEEKVLAHAREDVPDLCAKVERLRAENEKYKEGGVAAWHRVRCYERANEILKEENDALRAKLDRIRKAAGPVKNEIDESENGYTIIANAKLRDLAAAIEEDETPNNPKEEK